MAGAGRHGGTGAPSAAQTEPEPPARYGQAMEPFVLPTLNSGVDQLESWAQCLSASSPRRVGAGGSSTRNPRARRGTAWCQWSGGGNTAMHRVGSPSGLARGTRGTWLGLEGWRRERRQVRRTALLVRKDPVPHIAPWRRPSARNGASVMDIYPSVEIANLVCPWTEASGVVLGGRLRRTDRHSGCAERRPGR